MNVDLHCHTNVSDGNLSPAELIALAVERNINMLSITDHDSIQAYERTYLTLKSVEVTKTVLKYHSENSRWNT